MGRRRQWWQRTETRAMVLLLGIGEPFVNTPGATTYRDAGRGWIFPTFSETTAQNLTGLPARFFNGDHQGGPQSWQAIAGQLEAADPIQGVSISGAGKWPVVPGRRPPLAPATPFSRAQDEEGDR